MNITLIYEKLVKNRLIYLISVFMVANLKKRYYNNEHVNNKGGVI